MLTPLPRARSLIAFALLFIAVLCGVAVQGYASKTDLMSISAAEMQKQDPTIRLTQGTAEIVDIEGPIADIMIANPAIVDVSVLQSNRLYIAGIAYGDTNIIAIDENGETVARMNVHVTRDTSYLQDMIRKLFSEEVNVETVHGRIILTGSVDTPETAQQVQNLVANFLAQVEGREIVADEWIVNLMTVRGKAQVMLRVKVMEVSRTLLKERGTDTDIEDIGGLLGPNIRTNPDDAILDGFFGGVVSTGVTEVPFAAFGLLENLGAFGPIDSVITLLEESGLARVLAEPNLTAISGEQAGFLAGGEFPVPSGRDSEGNIEIIFRQFGVSLSFQPVVMTENRIVLRLETEVSSLARENQVTLADVEVPGLDVRRASTTVEMGSGATLMIAGLLQSQTFKNLTGIPGMVNTPIIGDLMSSESFRRDETEMVVLVTPYLVQPFSDGRQAKKIPAQEKEKNVLAHAFASNIRRTFGDVRVSELFQGEQTFGYLID